MKKHKKEALKKKIGQAKKQIENSICKKKIVWNKAQGIIQVVETLNNEFIVKEKQPSTILNNKKKKERVSY